MDLLALSLGTESRFIIEPTSQLSNQIIICHGLLRVSDVVNISQHTHATQIRIASHHMLECFEPILTGLHMHSHAHIWFDAQIVIQWRSEPVKFDGFNLHRFRILIVILKYVVTSLFDTRCSYFGPTLLWSSIVHLIGICKLLHLSNVLCLSRIKTCVLTKSSHWHCTSLR